MLNETKNYYLVFFLLQQCLRRQLYIFETSNEFKFVFPRVVRHKQQIAWNKIVLFLRWLTALCAVGRLIAFQSFSCHGKFFFCNHIIAFQSVSCHDKFFFCFLSVFSTHESRLKSAARFPELNIILNWEKVCQDRETVTSAHLKSVFQNSPSVGSYKSVENGN